MADDRDHYEAWYAEQLWSLLPEVYRASDSDDFDQKGPLREVVNRIGAQAAIIRRSIDQLWDDQSIESCDEWAIPYIGELVGANLVAANPRGLRLQAAKAIYYRRRAGTVSILEEAARDVTGWNTRVVEFFRRLTRTQHLLDPEKGLTSASRDQDGEERLQIAQHLVGRVTRMPPEKWAGVTPAGGWADLRNAYTASRAQRAFDELSHTADVRKGSGALGWQNIPHLGIFVWRLHSFPESADDLDGLLTMPVESTTGGCWTFDSTGRDVPLFAAASRGASLGSRWVPPEEWQLPTPIDEELFDHYGDAHLYLHNDCLGVFLTSVPHPVPLAGLRIDPERGRFSGVASNPALRVLYHYGSAARIGAGAYDRRLPPSPAGASVIGGGAALLPALAVVAPGGTLTIDDSLTYTDVADVGAIKDVTIRSDNGKRPLIRASAAEWKFTAPQNGSLRLEGVFVSGTDIVLAGDFESATIAFSTLDPGSVSYDTFTPSLFARAIDGRELRPSRVFVEGHVALLRIESSITGPIRTRGGGVIEHLEIDGSVVQMIPSIRFDGTLLASALFDLEGFVARLRDGRDAMSSRLASEVSNATRTELAAYSGGPVPAALLNDLFVDLNAKLPLIDLRPAGGNPLMPLEQGRVNHRLIAESFSVELSDQTIALSSGEVSIVRSTILGPAQVHRIDVSESILHDVFLVDDPQHGCVRFSAWARGSVLPRKYESVEIAPRALLFTSRNFGDPGYVQLRRNADRAIRRNAAAVATQPSIREGAENGSEMGACYPEMNAIKERGLLLELQELMPLGLVPVLVPVT
jgi:hypothetical protein